MEYDQMSFMDNGQNASQMYNQGQNATQVYGQHSYYEQGQNATHSYDPVQSGYCYPPPPAPVPFQMPASQSVSVSVSAVARPSMMNTTTALSDEATKMISENLRKDQYVHNLYLLYIVLYFTT
jgi:hypothetical protein